MQAMEPARTRWWQPRPSGAWRTRFLADYCRKSVPIGHAESLGDELKALAYGDLEILGGECCT